MKQYNKYPEVTRFEDIAAIVSSAASLLLVFWYYSKLREYVEAQSYIKIKVRAGFILTIVADIVIMGVIIYDSVAKKYSIIQNLLGDNRKST